MEVGAWLAVTGGVLTALLGLLGLLLPARAARMVGVVPDGPRGVAEVRATYGGFFLALGVMTLVLHGPEGWLVAGVAWGGAAAGRLLSMALDGDRGHLNLGGVVLEGVLAALFLAHRLLP